MRISDWSSDVCSSDLQAGDALDLADEAFGEALLRVQPGADRRAALGELVETRQGALDARDAVFHLRRVAGEFLPQGQRRRVLRVGAADLDDLLEAPRLRVPRLVQPRQRGQRSEGQTSEH